MPKASWCHLLAMALGAWVFGARDCSAQDLIVFQRGDSLNCKVRGTDRRGIHYEYLFGDIWQQAYVLRSDVVDVVKGFFEMHYAGGRSRSELHGYPWLRITLLGGLGLNDSDPTATAPGLRTESGTSVLIDGGTHFHIIRRMSAGVQVTWSRCQMVTDHVDVTLSNGTVWKDARLEEDVRVLLVGPTLRYYHPVGKRGSTLLASGFYVLARYRNHLGTPDGSVLHGRQGGMRIGVGLDLAFTRNLSGAFMINRFVAQLDNKVMENGLDGRNLVTDREYIRLNRIDFSMGLSFRY